MPPTVRIPTVLAHEVLKQGGESPLFRAYLVARQLDTDGTGWLARDAATGAEQLSPTEPHERRWSAESALVAPVACTGKVR